MPAKEHEFSLRGDGNVLKLVSDDGCITTKISKQSLSYYIKKNQDRMLIRSCQGPQWSRD